MNYWLTTHYPHETAVQPWSIFLKDAYRESRGEEIEVGDRVAFYELKGKVGAGREGVVAFAIVSGSIRRNVHREGSVDEAEQTWEWEVPCTKHAFAPFVARDDLYKILGRSPKSRLRLRGGLMRLDQTQFKRLENAG